jgi:hypothetical protein
VTSFDGCELGTLQNILQMRGKLAQGAMFRRVGMGRSENLAAESADLAPESVELARLLIAQGKCDEVELHL